MIGGKSVSLHREPVLVRWIYDMLRDGVGLDNESVLSFAMSCIPELLPKTHNARICWLKRFKSRHRIVYRRISHTGQSDPFQLSMAKAVFGEMVTRLLKTQNIDPRFVWNMDQTGVVFDTHGRKVLAGKGTNKIWTYSREQSQKGYRVSVFLTVSQAGIPGKPFVVFPGKKDGIIMNQEVPTLNEGALYTLQRNGWADTPTLIEYLEEVFIPLLIETRSTCAYKGPAFLLLDAHSSHGAIEVVNLLQKHDTFIISIPPGTTSKCQPYSKS